MNVPILDHQITVEEVQSQINNIKPDKACGPDEVSPGVLKMLPAQRLLTLAVLLSSPIGGASRSYFKNFCPHLRSRSCPRMSFGFSERQLLKASTNLNQIFTHDFYLDNLGQVQKWASQVTCNLPPQN